MVKNIPRCNSDGLDSTARTTPVSPSARESFLPPKKSFTQYHSTSPAKPSLLSSATLKDPLLSSPHASSDIGSGTDKKPKNVLKRKPSSSLRPTTTHSTVLTSLDPHLHIKTRGHPNTPAPAQTGSGNLTPAGEVAEAYKMQERQITCSNGSATPTDIPSRARSPHLTDDEDEDRNIMPYYTVLGSTTGRVVAIGSPLDSSAWLPTDLDHPAPAVAEITRRPSARMQYRSAKSVPPTLSTATASASLYYPPPSPGHSPSFSSKSPSSSASSGGGGKLWKLMKRVSTGGLREKYYSQRSPDIEAPPVPKLPAFSPAEQAATGAVVQVRHAPSLDVIRPVGSAAVSPKEGAFYHRTVSEHGHGPGVIRPLALASTRIPPAHAEELSSEIGLVIEIGIGSRGRPDGRILGDEDIADRPSTASSQKSKSSSSHDTSKLNGFRHRPATVNVGIPSSSHNTSSDLSRSRPTTISVPPARSSSLKGRSTSASRHHNSSHHPSTKSQPHVSGNSRDPSPYRQTSSTAALPACVSSSSRPSTSSGRPSTMAPSPSTVGGYSSSQTSIDDSPLSKSDHIAALPKQGRTVGRFIVSAEDRTRMEAEFAATSQHVDSGSVSEPDIRSTKKKTREERKEQEVPIMNLPVPPRHRQKIAEQGSVKIREDHGQQGMRSHERDKHVYSKVEHREERPRAESPLIPAFSVNGAINTFGPRTNLGNNPVFPMGSLGRKRNDGLAEHAESEAEYHPRPTAPSSPTKSIKRRPSLKSLLLPTPSTNSSSRRPATMGGYTTPSYKRPSPSSATSSLTPNGPPISSSSSSSSSSLHSTSNNSHHGIPAPSRPSRSPARPPPPSVIQERRLASTSAVESSSGRGFPSSHSQYATLRPNAKEKLSHSRPRSNSMGQTPASDRENIHQHYVPSSRKTIDIGHRASDAPTTSSSAMPSWFNFRPLEGTPGRKLTEDEKMKRWDDLLQRSAAAGGTLHLGASNGRLESDDYN